VLALPGFTERILALFGSFVDIDFSRYDLVEPLPPLTTNAEQGALDKICQVGSGKTLRQSVRDSGTSSTLELVGSPDPVAGLMGEAMEAVGGDGFLLTAPYHRLTSATLRETLLEF
jgi:alkanesulfonate monooxygenase SsuD/methylene tetrahydromethanopterin reductase-like flavin-dependent oxidoreductase (luciferase family)